MQFPKKSDADRQLHRIAIRPELLFSPVPLRSKPIRFLIVGALGAIVDIGLFVGLTGIQVPEAAGRLVSLTVATGATWVLNRSVTFAPSPGSRKAEVSRYFMVTIMAQGVSFGAFLLLRVAMTSLPAVGAIVVAALLASVCSYFGHRYFTFQKDIRE